MSWRFLAEAKETGTPADLNGNKCAGIEGNHRVAHGQQSFGYWLAAAIP